MSKILQNIIDVDPNDSDAVKNVLSEFFQNLPNYTDVDCRQWLRSLEKVINRMPRFCSSHRTTIESYLANFVDSINYFDVIEAAKCAHALQQVRPLQEKSATAKFCWKEHLIGICNAAHRLIDAIFPDAPSIINVDTVPELKPLFNFTKESPLYKALQSTSVTTIKSNLSKEQILSNRLRNVFVFIQAALVEVYPVPKQVQPLLILQALSRVLNLSSKDNHQSVANIANIKIEALKMMDALIVCLRGNLLSFSRVFILSVLQTLKWCSQVPDHRDSKRVRCAAYDSLTRWLRVLGPEKFLPENEDEIVAYLLADIKPYKPVIQLTVNAQPSSSKQMSKKARRKQVNAQLGESSLAAHAPGEKNKISTPEQKNVEVVNAALRCVEVLLSVSGIFLKPSTHKSFQELLVRECYSLHKHPGECAVFWVRALDAARRGALPVVPAPTQYCMNLYVTLLSHSDSEVSKFCSDALLDIRLHLHCSPPSLSFDLEAVEKEKPPEKQKKVSERNRAALVSLLGEDKMPDESENVVLIDLSDEPSNKRRRYSQVDNISLSSQSNDAVIIEDVDDVNDLPQSNDRRRVNGGQDCENGYKKITETVNINPVSFEGVLSLEDPTSADLKILGECNFAKECAQMIEEINGAAESGQETNKNDQMSVDNDTTDAPSAFENIHEAITQMPVMNASNETVEGERSPLSMEVTYDFPNTGKDKVTVIERAEEDNLPSTNDTDDVHITCGQIVKNSQDEVDSNKDSEIKQNGKIAENGENSLEEENKTDGNPKNEKLKQVVAAKASVEDMLADFVDEVADDNKANT